MELPEQIPEDRPAVLVLSLPPAEARRVVDALLGRSAPRRPPSRPRSCRVDWGQLTDLEREIADLVRQAMTNRQIATRVGKSPHTVNYHLRQIFKKLGLASRVELAALARDESPLQTGAGRP
ncbi:helix-turn-helix domain-containing protein [Actinoplanes subtropicus]|uniref:helix-turn-helix domain-containing protein n=1 Tax=Actinoplanes subtropicus TaxID=543632 RepID=UPI000550F3DB|nr:helix-turn-helix transcriptional regulator [Actinoplanes subtropicus]